MAEEPKKISFGFSKISKKTTLTLPPKKEEKEVQFIDCLEGNAIKLVDGEEKEKGELVIPLKNANLLRDSMIEALKARKEERIAKKNVNDANNENGSNVDESRPLTLDEIAAKEILEDLTKPHEIEEATKIMEIPASSNATVGEKESTLEDYENVPVQEFGLAVLRGMGWNPEKGIGKNGKIVEPVNPVLRPKGMGLGADKVIKKPVVTGNQEELIMKKSSPLKIISGPYKNLYGKIEAFDELPGRIMVRLTLQNTVISISENLVQLVTASEFNKNSKILNLTDFQEYHESLNKKKNTLANSEEKKSENIKKREKSMSLSPEQSRHRRRRSSASDSEENYRKSKDKLQRRSSPTRNRERKSRSRSPASRTSHRKKRDESIRKHKNHNKERRRRHSSSSPEQERKSKRERSLSSDSEKEYKKLKSSKGKHKSNYYRSLSDSSDSESDEKSRKKEKRKSKRSSSPESSPDRARKSKKSNKRDEVVTKKKKKKKRHRSSS